MDFLPDETNRMRLRDRVLEIPPFLRLLSESDELFACRGGKHPEIFVLSAVLEFLRAFPYGEIRATWRKLKIDNVGKCELL